MGGRGRLRQGDVVRALKGLLAAGLKISRIEITPEGGMIVEVLNEFEAGGGKIELDNWLKRHAG
jgi:hypothetical protein